MADTLGKVVGTKVHLARKRRRLTQEQLAAQVNKTPESISNIERGKQLPSIETLSDLASVLEIPIADFFDRLAAVRSSPPGRLKLEAKLMEAASRLGDDDLAIAIAQLAVLADGRKAK